MNKIKEYWVIISFIGILIFSGGKMQQKDKMQDDSICNVRTDLSATKMDVKDNTKAIFETKMLYSEVNGKLSSIPRIEKQMDDLSKYLMTYDFKPREE
jgi:hypothetical protein